MRMIHDSELRFLVNCRLTLAGLRTELLCCWPGCKIFFDVDGQAAKFSSQNLIFRLFYYLELVIHSLAAAANSYQILMKPSSEVLKR